MPKKDGENSEVDDSKDTSEDSPDDTSQEENEEEESSEEDTDDSTDESEEEDSDVDEEDSEETSDDDSSEEEEEDITNLVFTDPNSLDPDPKIAKRLTGAFKKMQAIYTRKMQEATSVIDKAEAFSELMAIPEVRAIVEGKAGKTKQEEDDIDEDTEFSDDKPLTAKGLMQLLNKVLEQRELPKKQAALQRRILKERNEFMKSNPDWKLYRADMHSLLKKHPSLSFQDAYDMAKNRNSNRKKRMTVEEIKARKNANLKKSSSVGSKKVVKDEKVTTIQQAAEKAKRMLGLSKK